MNNSNFQYQLMAQFFTILDVIVAIIGIFVTAIVQVGIWGIDGKIEASRKSNEIEIINHLNPYNQRLEVLEGKNITKEPLYKPKNKPN